LEWGALNHFKK